MDKLRCYIFIWLTACSVIFVVGCSTPTTGVVPSAPMIGLHISETNLNEYTSHLARAAELNIKVIRMPLDWNALEPVQYEFNTDYIEEVKARVLSAQAQGQKTVLMFAQSPPWANGGQPPAFPPQSAYYQSFADAMLYLHKALITPNDHYAIKAGTLLAWEVWNEPNSVEFWGTHAARANTFVLIELKAAEEYAALLEACFTTMKSSFKDAVILGGSLASADVDYLQSLYDSWQGAAKFDHLALHPYSRVDEEPGLHYGLVQYPGQCNKADTLSPPWCFKQGIESIRAVLDKNGDTEKQIWLTEFGVSSDAHWGGAGSEAEQGKHMQQSLDILTEWAEHADAMNIPLAIAYRLKDDGDDQYGLFRENLQIKPVATEIQQRLDSAGALMINIK